SRRTAIFSVMASMCIALVLFTNIILVAKNHLVLGTFYVAAFMLQSVMQPFCNGLNRVLEDGGNKIYFGFCRSIGSLVYSIVVVALGYMVDSYTVDIIPKAGILTTLVLLIVVWFSYRAHRQNTLMAGEKYVEHEAPAEKINLRAFLKDHRMFFMVNLGVLGLYVGNATVNTFMAQIVRAVGGNNGEAGLVLSVLAFLEVPAMMTFDKYSKRIQCSTLLKFSAVV
ncbi:MAG: MFS transporter, partial [[Eubacterium] sulci]|nr:MFS transporter [[Eubacterium] sulci]